MASTEELTQQAAKITPLANAMRQLYPYVLRYDQPGERWPRLLIEQAMREAGQELDAQPAARLLAQDPQVMATLRRQADQAWREVTLERMDPEHIFVRGYLARALGGEASLFADALREIYPYLKRVERTGETWPRQLVENVLRAPLVGERADLVPQGKAATGVSADARLLGEAIAKAAQDAGIYNGEVSLTGPMLVQLVNDLASGYVAMSKNREPALIESVLEEAFANASQQAMPPMPATAIPYWFFALGFRAAAFRDGLLPHPSGERTPADYAVEHGGYLADGLDGLIADLEAEDQLRVEKDNSPPDMPTAEADAQLEVAQNARVESVRNVRDLLHEFRKRADRAQLDRQASIAALGPWRKTSEHDKRAMVGKTALTPDGEKLVKWVTAEGEVQCTDASTYRLEQVQVRGPVMIDLDHVTMDNLRSTIAQLPNVPEQLGLDDLMWECQEFLKERYGAAPADPREPDIRELVVSAHGQGEAAAQTTGAAVARTAYSQEDVASLIQHVRDIPTFVSADRQKAVESAVRGIENLAVLAGVPVQRNASSAPVLEQTLSELRAAGYAVVVFNPEELRGVEANLVESRLVGEGSEVIGTLVPSLQRQRSAA